MRLLAVVLGCMLVAAPLAAQRRPSTFSAAWSDTKYASESRHSEGLMLGIGWHFRGPFDLTLRAGSTQTDSDGRLNGDFLVAANLPVTPFEFVGLLGLSTWWPEPGEDSDEHVTVLTTAIGGQMRVWVFDRLGVTWEGLKRGLLDNADERSGHIAIGLMTSF